MILRPWNQAAVELLRAEGPQDRRTLRDFIAARVPPGIAYRVDERCRQSKARGRGAIPISRGRPESSIRHGANQKANESIYGFIRSGRWCHTTDGRIADAQQMSKQPPESENQ